MKRHSLARCAVLVVAALLVGRSAAADKPVSFPAILDGYIKARIRRTQLPQIERGLRFERAPAVFIAITPSALLVFGKRIHTLTAGYVAKKTAVACASSVRCLPALRDAIAEARAQLGKALRSVPRILILLDRRVPYETLLLAVRSAAEAGAHRSIRLVGVNAAGALLELPVLVAPRRQHTIDSAAPPGLITVEMVGESGIVSATRLYQPNGPVRAPSLEGILQEIGQLQLASGRAAYFLGASAGTTCGSVTAIVSRAREMFRYVILMAPGARPIVSGRT